MSEVPPVVVSPEDALTHHDPVVRITARGAISDWTERLQAWLNEEFKRTDDKADVLIAVTRLFVMTHSSLAANMIKETGFTDMADTFKVCIDAEYVRHANQCLVYLQAQKEGQR